MRKFIIKVLEKVLKQLKPSNSSKPEMCSELAMPTIQIVDLQRVESIECREADAIEAEFAELINGLDLLDHRYMPQRLPN